MSNLFQQDFYRMTGKLWSVSTFAEYIIRYDLRYLHFLRKRQNYKKRFLKRWYSLKSMCWNQRFGLDIQTNEIGVGLYIGHAHNINVSPDVKIGNNCNLSKGVTIGRENRGLRKGAPQIGNNVWIGTNATLVGNIVIGNDVLIAPNSFVNGDIPDHSIVLGNPYRIIPNDKATEAYIDRIIL